MKFFTVFCIASFIHGSFLDPTCDDYTYEVCFDHLDRCFDDCAPFNNFPRPNMGDLQTPVAYRLHTTQDSSIDDWEPISPDNTGNRFEAARPTILIIHGFAENPNTNWVQNMTETLRTQMDYNIVIVDWRWAALPDIGDPVSPIPASNTRVLGVEIHLLLEALRVEKGLDLQDVHCTAFSAGVHGCAFLGKRYEEDGLSIKRITGLDPGTGIFVDPEDDPRIRIAPSDADFVDIIHTNARGVLTASGLDINCGDVDFWPQQGGPQPGCGFDDICNHRRATFLFIGSIIGCMFEGDFCESYEDMLNGTCEPCSGDNCQYMGLPAIDYSGRGTYSLETGDNFPFC